MDFFRTSSFKLAFLLIFVGVLPLISVLVAAQIASWAGCALHEGFKNPCIINGTDWGELLFTMLGFGWLMLVSLPIAAAGVLMLLIQILKQIWLALRNRH